jgi:DNA-binding GntR family transcriptional regulator
MRSGGEAVPTLPVLSLTDALTSDLRGRITSGSLGPGDVLSEVGLAKHYDIARPTAKAAVERLVTEGLLERAAHKSARVPVMDLARVRDMYFARRLIEAEAYWLLAEHGSIPEEAVAANASLRAAAEAAALIDFVDADVQFHRSLIDHLKSSRITKTHSALINEMRLCLVQVQAQNLLDPLVIAREHEGILDAIGRMDQPEAAEAGRQHLDHALARLAPHLSS